MRRSLGLEPLQRLVDAVVLVLGVAVLVLVVAVVAAGGLLVTGRGCVSKVAGAQVHPAKQAAAAIQAVRHVAPGQWQRQLLSQSFRCPAIEAEVAAVPPEPVRAVPPSPMPPLPVQAAAATHTSCIDDIISWTCHH